MTAARPKPGEQAELDALISLAQREHVAGRLAEAAAAYRKILALRPDIADAYKNLGNILLHQDKLDEAAAQYRQALALKPSLFEAHNNLGIILARQDKLDQAQALFEQALAVQPDFAEAHNNLGNALWKQGKLEPAAEQFQQAVALRPDYVEAHDHLGNVLLSLGKLDQAAARYAQALALRPGYAKAQLGLAACYLIQGDYARGWPAYEARLRKPGFLPQHNLPRWSGEPLEGRSLLLLNEQGAGDTFQFVRYARLLKRRGARVVLACQAALGPLLTSHPDLDELFILGSAADLPRCDFCLPLLSAPGAFHTTTSTIPCDVPYLWADPELTDKWRQELAAIDGFKIGISWQGSRGYSFDRWRSIPLAQFATLASVPGVRLVSLQKGFGSEQIATVDFPVLDLSARLDEAAGAFMDTAAVLCNLDLVVTADTAIGHLAGALGAPVWVALQFSGNWRWLRDRDDSPWYPTVRLFRQTAFGEWSDVFERIANAVRASGTCQKWMAATGPTPGEPAGLDDLVALAGREHRAGRLDAAVDAYRQILAHWPHIAEVYNNLGNVLQDQGQLEQAAAQYERAVALKPALFQAHNNLGNVFQKQGQLDQAVARYQQAIALSPDYVEAHSNLGIVLWQQGKLDQAVARYRQVLALQPDLAGAHYNLANALKQQDKLDEAAAHYEQALALRPDYPDAHNNLGNVLQNQGKLDRAAACYEQALALRPVYAEAHTNLGIVLGQQGKLAEAIQRYQDVLDLQPDFVDARYNLAYTLQQQARFDEAAAQYQQALACAPDHVEAQLGLAACYLIQGDYARGWPEYEARLSKPGFLPQHNLPRWRGEPLAGRRLLLLTEQGIGDTLQFVRYARLLKQQGTHIILAAQAALGRLLTSHPDVDQLYLLGAAEPLPRCDCYLPLMSVPGELGTTPSTIPCKIPYLWADPELTDKWRPELAAIDGFKIGISWQGSRVYSFDRWRSIPLADFAPLAGVPSVRLVSLQKGFGSEQIATVDFPVLDLSDRLDEAAGAFMDTAAVLGNLDLVVTADTAIAHLAGALGVPVWVALPFSPHWVWLEGRDDSPWYPTVRLFRQTALGEWPDVFKRIANAVRERGTRQDKNG